MTALLEATRTTQVAGPGRKRQSKHDQARREAARVNDIRLATDFPDHRKTLKLRYMLEAQYPGINLGDKAFRCLITLWARAGKRHRSGELDLSVEDLEIEAGWRDMVCPPEHHGLFVAALLRVGFLEEVRPDASYQLHDWIEHQPWVTESLVASVTGRFHKLVALGKRDGLSQEEALARAHQLVPQFAQLTKKTLEDQLDELASIPEQREIEGIGASREAVHGEKPVPHTASRKTSSARAKMTVDTVLRNITCPDGLDPALLRRFVEQRRHHRMLKVAEVQALARDLAEAAESIDLQKLLQIMVESGYVDVPLTIRCNRHRLLKSGTSTGGEPTQATMRRDVSTHSKSTPSTRRRDPSEDERINSLFAAVGIDLTSPNAIDQWLALDPSDVARKAAVGSAPASGACE